VVAARHGLRGGAALQLRLRRALAQRVPQRIILIDGAELTRLMIRYGVGVRTERTIELRRIDLDYFDEVDA
jgi:restriction endonuclease Mrr